LGDEGFKPFLEFLRACAETGKWPERPPRLSKRESASYTDEEIKEARELHWRFMQSMAARQGLTEVLRLEGKKNKRVLLGLDEDRYLFLKGEAERRGITMSKLIRNTIDFTRAVEKENPFAQQAASSEGPTPTETEE